MASLVSALDTEFTPAATPFLVQVTGSVATLLRKNSAGVPFAVVATLNNSAQVIQNPVTGAVYKFSAPSATAVVQADQ